MIETILTLLGFTKGAIESIIKFVQPKFSVTPKIIKFANEDWGCDGYFTVCNNTEKPLHNIQILLWHQIDGVSESTFPLILKNFEGQEDGPESRVGPIIVNTNVLIIDGEVKDKKVKFLQLGYLPPIKCIRIFYSSAPQQKAEILIQPIGYQKRPSQTLKNVNRLAIPFKPPISMKLLSVSLLMKREP